MPIALLALSVFIYFDFELSQPVLLSDNTLNVDMVYSLEGFLANDFVVRPVVSDGKVSIYNALTQTWVSGDALWSELPKLDKSVKVKIEGIPQTTTYLSFVVQHVKTAQTFATPKKKIWTHQLIESYITNLNSPKNVEQVIKESSVSTQSVTTLPKKQANYVPFVISAVLLCLYPAGKAVHKMLK